MRKWKKLAAAGIAVIIVSTAAVCAAAEKGDPGQTGSALQIQTDTVMEDQEAEASATGLTAVPAIGLTAVPAAETADPELPAEEKKEESPFIGTWVCGRATVEISLDKAEDGTDPAKKAAAEADKAAAGVTEAPSSAGTETPAAAGTEEAAAAGTEAAAAAGTEAAEETAETAETGAPAAAGEEAPAAAGTEKAAAAGTETAAAAGTEAPAAAGTEAAAAPAEAEAPAGDVFKVGILWGASYNEVCRWDYTCTPDKDGKVLTDPGTGIRSDLVFGADGALETTKVVYTDGAAEFSLDEEGKLLWNDKKEDAAQDMAFERVSFYSEAPTAKELADGFFRVIGGYEQGVSGTSLKEAIAACRAFGFAGTFDIMNASEEELQQNLEAAWKSLRQEEKDAFNINYPGVISLVDSCLSDWEGVRGLFEDAGVVNEMAVLLEDSRTKASWAELLQAFGKADTGDTAADAQ